MSHAYARALALPHPHCICASYMLLAVIWAGVCVLWQKWIVWIDLLPVSPAVFPHCHLCPLLVVILLQFPADTSCFLGWFSKWMLWQCLPLLCFVLNKWQTLQWRRAMNQQQQWLMKTYILSNVVPNIRKWLPDLAALLWLTHNIMLLTSPSCSTGIQRLDLIGFEWDCYCICEGHGLLQCTQLQSNPTSVGSYRRIPRMLCLHWCGAGLWGWTTGCCWHCAGTWWCWESWMRQRCRSVDTIAVSSGSSKSDWQELKGLWTNQTADRVLLIKHFTVVNGNLWKIKLQPGVQEDRRGSTVGNDDNIAAVVLTAKAGSGVPPASLSPNPKNLFELWDEYQHWNWRRKKGTSSLVWFLKCSAAERWSINTAGGMCVGWWFLVCWGKGIHQKRQLTSSILSMDSIWVSPAI